MSKNKESVEQALRVVEGHGNVLVMRQMAKADEWKQKSQWNGSSELSKDVAMSW